LNVSHNALQLLEPNATTERGSEVSNVKVLDLSYNNVTRIGRNYLRPAERSLTHLHLSHNRLSNATREVFGSMPHLQWLDLCSNELAELDYDAFRNTRTLQVGAIYLFPNQRVSDGQSMYHAWGYEKCIQNVGWKA
jgi:Leucine-rich repeat (LRR) protein